MARLPFVDTHVHFFDLRHPDLRYAWLDPDAPHLTDTIGTMDPIRATRYWADDFLAETRFQNVGKVVHVQAAIGSEDPVGETRWLQAFADRLGAPHGIVAALDLTREDVGEQLARHAESPNMRGIRDLRFDDYLQDPAWARGLEAMERHGDLVWCYDPNRLEDAARVRDLARRHPGVTVCLDHTGYPPDRTEETFVRWTASIRTLAEAENAVVKVCGLGVVDHAWTVDSIRPYVLGCIEAFGVERTFFGTNWPIDRLYSSYGDILDAYEAVVADFSEPERRALFSGNAERIFRV